MAHAKNSPSGAEGWMNCAHWEGSSESSAAADAGTARHEWAAMLLEGKTVEHGQESVDAPGHFYTIDERRDVGVAVKNVQERIQDFIMRGAVSVDMHVEQKLPIDHITGETDATGTSDVVLIVTWPDGSLQCDVIDHKFGYRAVSAVGNKQGRMYLLGAIEHFSLLGDFSKASFAVNQPQARPTIHDDEMGMEELLEFKISACKAAEMRLVPESFPAKPGAHCDKSYCAKRATCGALRTLVIDEFENVEPPVATEDELASAMARVDLIESWCSAVRGEVAKRLKAGTPVNGWKLVAGKKGNRAWSDEAEAEALLKAMKVKHDAMYQYKLVSPTTAATLAADGVIGPRQWPRVQALITQADGKPAVAPESDKHPALVTSAESDFQDVTDLS